MAYHYGAQDRDMAKITTPQPGIAGDDRWSDQQWLGWWLDNHQTTELIPLGLWKSRKFILKDLETVPDTVAAMRAAYRLEGPAACLMVLASVLRELHPETYVPPLPDDWDARGQRYRNEPWVAPGQRPVLFGVRKPDR